MGQTITTTIFIVATAALLPSCETADSGDGPTPQVRYGFDPTYWHWPWRTRHYDTIDTIDAVDTIDTIDTIDVMGGMGDMGGMDAIDVGF